MGAQGHAGTGGLCDLGALRELGWPLVVVRGDWDGAGVEADREMARSGVEAGPPRAVGRQWRDWTSGGKGRGSLVWLWEGEGTHGWGAVFGGRLGFLEGG